MLTPLRKKQINDEKIQLRHTQEAFDSSERI